MIDPQSRLQVWQRLPDLPYGMYYHKVTVHGSSAYITGGHLCSETKGNMSNYYLNHVLKLDLTPWLTDKKWGLHRDHQRNELRRLS